MIYKFKSKVTGDVIMMEPGGVAVLRIIGKEPAAKGIIESSSMPAAMKAIEQAVAADEAAGKPDGDYEHGIVIRDGILCVCKGAVIPSGFSL